MAEEQRNWSLSSTRMAWLALAGLVVLHLLLGILLFDPKPFIGGDNAGYMILAESIESGQGYRDIYLPDAPRHAQYPPLYPSVLALAGLFGGGALTFKVVSLIFTATTVIFGFLLGRLRLGRAGGLAVAIPLAVSPVLLYYSHWVLSEAPFVLLTLVGLWSAERMEDGQRWLLLAVFFGLLAYLTRAAGLPLLLALLFALGWRRSWRQLGAVGAAMAVVVGGWWWWGRLAASESAHNYSSNFLLFDPYAPASGYIGPGDLLARAVNNVRLYSVEVLPVSLAGNSVGAGVGLLALLSALLMIALALVAWIRDIRQVRPLECFTLFYAGLIVIWPQVWTDRRFLLPLLPILFLHVMGGANWSFDFAKARRPKWSLPVLGVLLALLSFPDHVRSIAVNRRCLQNYRAGDGLSCYAPNWRAFFETALWTRENTSADAVVVSRKPRLFYLISARKGAVYPFTTGDEEMLAFLDDIGAEYVVVAGLSHTTLRYLVPVIQSVPERFAVIHSVGDEFTAGYVLAYRSALEAGLPPQDNR